MDHMTMAPVTKASVATTGNEWKVSADRLLEVDGSCLENNMLKSHRPTDQSLTLWQPPVAMEECAIPTLLSKPLCDCFGRWHIAAVVVWMEALALSTNTGQLLSKLKWNCESTTQSRKGDMHETRLLQQCYFEGKRLWQIWSRYTISGHSSIYRQAWKNKATTSTSRRFLLAQSSNPKDTSQRIRFPGNQWLSNV